MWKATAQGLLTRNSDTADIVFHANNNTVAFCDSSFMPRVKLVSNADVYSGVYQNASLLFTRYFSNVLPYYMLVVDGLLTNISLYVQAEAAPKGPVQFDHSDYSDFNLAHAT